MVKSAAITSEKDVKTAAKKTPAPAAQHTTRHQDGFLLQSLQSGVLPANLRPADILQLQRTLGNRAVGALLRGPAQARPLIQAKLTIGQPADQYEQEADRIAAQVVEQINAPASSKLTQDQPEQSQTLSGNSLQTKPVQQLSEAIQGGEASTYLEAAINRAKGGGQPLDKGLQQSMGQAMGADFSGVRVHTDAQADRLNQSIQAKAFTSGQDIFFRQGEYSPSNRGGQELLAHELTHVVQQRGKEKFSQGDGLAEIPLHRIGIQATTVLEGETNILNKKGKTSMCIEASPEIMTQRIQRTVSQSATYPVTDETVLQLITDLDNEIGTAVTTAKTEVEDATNGKNKNPTSHQVQYILKHNVTTWGYCVEEQLDEAAIVRGWKTQHALAGSRPDYFQQIGAIDAYVDLTTAQQAGVGGNHITGKLINANITVSGNVMAADITHNSLNPLGTQKANAVSLGDATPAQAAAYQEYRAAQLGDAGYTEWFDTMEKTYGKKIGYYTFFFMWTKSQRNTFVENLNKAKNKTRPVVVADRQRYDRQTKISAARKGYVELGELESVNNSV